MELDEKEVALILHALWKYKKGNFFQHQVKYIEEVTKRFEDKFESF